MPIPNRYYEAVRGWSGSGADRHRRHATASTRSPRRSGRSIGTAASPPPPATRSTRPAPTRRNTGTAPRSSASRPATWSPRSCCAPEGAGFRSKQRLEPGGQRRRVDRPDHGRGRPGRQRLGHRLVQLHRPAQPDAAGFRTGKGAAYETELRDKKHGRIYRLVYVGQAASLPDKIELRLAGRLPHSSSSPRSRATTCSGGCTPSGCSSSAATRTSCRALVELARDQIRRCDRPERGAIHALGRSHGLGRSTRMPRPTASPSRRLKHPSAGVRRNAVQVLPATDESLAAMLDSGVLADRDVAGPAAGAFWRWRNSSRSRSAAAAVVAAACRSGRPERPRFCSTP